MPRRPWIETARSTARRCAFALGALAGAAATAGAQAGPVAPGELHPDTAARLATLATDAELPILRGEAALILGTLGATAHETAIRAVAEDPAVEAQVRGLIALARLGPAGAEVEFGRRLKDLPPRDPRRHAAAYGLGLLPDDQPTPEIDAYATRHVGGNYRRERDTIAALIGGLATKPHPSRRRICLNVLGDASIRDDGVRALAVLALMAANGAPAIQDFEDVLHRGDGPLESRARILALQMAGVTIPEATLRELERAARRAPDPRVRAAALRVLLEERRPIVVELAERALDSEHPDEVTAAADVLLTAGGPGRRDLLLDRILVAEAADVRTALFDAWRGEVPEPLEETASEIATDPAAHASLRLAAARLLMRVEDPRAPAALRDLAESTSDAAILAETYRALLTAGAGGEVVRGAEAAATDPDARPVLAARIGALVRARFPGAQELVSAVVAEEDLDPATICEVLVAWRRAVQPPLSDLERAALPADLLPALD